MDANEAKQIVAKNIELIDTIKEKFEQATSFLALSDTVFAEADDIFKRCDDYLSKPDDGGKNAPIPAWRGANPDKKETNKAMDLLNDIMNNAIPLMTEIGSFRGKFNAFGIEFTAYLEIQNGEFKKMNFIANPLNADFIHLAEVMKKVPDLDIEVSKLNSLSNEYEIAVKKIKKQVNLLKGVN